MKLSLIIKPLNMPKYILNELDQLGIKYNQTENLEEIVDFLDM